MGVFEPIGREENREQAQEEMGMLERSDYLDAPSCNLPSKGQTEASGKHFLIDIVVGFASQEDAESTPEFDDPHIISQD